MMEDIVLSIGSNQFCTTLFKSLRESLSIRQLIVYRYPAGAPIETLAAESAEDDGNMRRVIGDYTGRYYRHDPILNELKPARDRQVTLHIVEAEKIVNADFRNRLYRSQRMATKTAIVVRRPSDILVVGLFRGDEAGTLSSGDQTLIHNCSGMLAAAVERHFDLVRRRDLVRPERWSELLRDIPKGAPLSNREADVCAYIVQGYSNEAIALSIGISIHSVITYRRRAYLKLGVTSQIELFSLLHHGVMDCDA